MFTGQKLADLIADTTKDIPGDIHWMPSDTHDGAQEFTVAVQSATGWPLRIEAWLSPGSRKLFLALIHADEGRIVGLCQGAGSIHHSPTCRRTRASKRRCDCPRSTHMHRWTEEFGDRWIYAPTGITAEADDPAAVWRQFCAEIKLTHHGILH